MKQKPGDLGFGVLGFRASDLGLRYGVQGVGCGI